MLRILLVEDAPAGASSPSRQVLEGLGYDVVGAVPATGAFHEEALRLAPDAIVVHAPVPSPGTLATLNALAERAPLPVVVFAADRSRRTIRGAIQAGVSAYVVDTLSPERIPPVLEAAMARFEVVQAMKRELDGVKTRLAERKLLDRAKGILMTSGKLTEDAAYRALRKQAMDRSLPIAEVARQVIAVADMIDPSGSARAGKA